MSIGLRGSRRALVLAPVLVAALATGLGAQTAAPEGLGGSAIPEPYADPERAIPMLEARVRAGPASAPLHVALAREYASLAILAAERDARLERLAHAVRAAREAVALAPDDAEAGYWLAISLGLTADAEDGRAKISAAREAYTVSLRVLELHPEHAGTMHVLGRLHAGALTLNWLNRLIARGLGLGELIGQASWESAEHHLRFAAERDPAVLVHALELGKLLVRRGAVEEGRRVLEEIATRAPRHALDQHWAAEARRAVGDLPPY